MNKLLDPYQVIKDEQASVLGQKVGTKLSSTQRQKDARQGLTFLWFDLSKEGKEKERASYKFHDLTTN